MSPNGLALLLGFLLLLVQQPPVSAYEQVWHTPPERWLGPRLVHSALSLEMEQRISVRHETRIDSKDLKVWSPNKAYWFAIGPKKRDVSASSVLAVFNERDYLTAIELEHHPKRAVQARWINEKLLYVQVWWSEERGAYFLYDVEAERIVLSESVYDASSVFAEVRQRTSGR